MAPLSRANQSVDVPVVGTRLIEVGGQVADYGVSPLEYGGFLGLQVPLARYVELSARYGHYDRKESVWEFSRHTRRDVGHAALTAFYPVSGFIPFAGASIQRTWVAESYGFGGTTLPTIRSRTDSWSVFAGVEARWQGFVFTGSVRYADEYNPRYVLLGYRGPIVQLNTIAVDYSLEVHRWLTRRLGVFAGFDRACPRDRLFASPAVTAYTGGTRIRF